MVFSDSAPVSDFEDDTISNRNKIHTSGIYRVKRGYLVTTLAKEILIMKSLRTILLQ